MIEYLTESSFLAAACDTGNGGDPSIPRRNYVENCTGSAAPCSLFTCSSGYNLLGNGATWCVNGNWNPPRGRCVRDPVCE